MSIAGPVSDSFWRQQQTTLSELLLRAGNQRAARLLSLAPAAELGEADVWDPIQVMLVIRPIFLDLFRPAELQAIAEQMSRLESWDDNTAHWVTVTPLLADPFTRATAGAGRPASAEPGPERQMFLAYMPATAWGADVRGDAERLPGAAAWSAYRNSGPSPQSTRSYL
jgi:hypothetical protein